MRILALFLVLIALCMPCVALAEQPSTEVSDAQLAGERDARVKAQMERFFTLGACAGSCLTFVGCLVSAEIADSVYPETERYNITRKKVNGLYSTFTSFNFGDGYSTTRTPIPEKIDAYNRLLTVGQIVSPLVGVLSSYWWVATRKPAPPATNFMGRSPAYIQAYTDVYQAKVRSIERGSFFVGSLLGAGCISALALEFGEKE